MGMYVVWITAKKPGMWLTAHSYHQHACLVLLASTTPEIPLEAYKLCIRIGSTRFEVAYVSLSLFFGNLSLICSENLR